MLVDIHLQKLKGLEMRECVVGKGERCEFACVMTVAGGGGHDKRV